MLEALKVTMTGSFDWIVLKWEAFWGSGYYQYFFAAALVYLIFAARKKKEAGWLAAYVLAALALFFFPVSVAVISYCIGADVYWRILWILQAPLVICAAVTFLTRDKKRGVTAAIAVVFIAVAAFGGKFILTGDTYEKVHNFQKIPDEVAGICNLVRSDAGDNEVLLAADDDIATYVRVYDPSILMPYGRRKGGARTKDAIELYVALSSAEKDYGAVGELAKSQNCNYLVAYITSEEEKQILNEKGYREVGMINSYGVYRLGEG